MNLIKSIKNIITSLYLSLKRFPLTILLSASTCVMLISISEINPSKDTLSKIAMVLALGIPLSLCIKLFFEKRNDEGSFKLLIGYLCGIIILILYYFLFMKDMGMVSTSRYIAVSLTLYLGFLYIPYLIKREQFEMYVITIFTGFFTTLIYSIVLFSGLSAILFTIDKLLGITILGKAYYYTWLFVIFIFALSYFLAGIPLKNVQITPKSYPKLLRILLLYIVMPLLTVYTIILYIYFGKIMITWQWPIGIVSHLVLWYSVIITILLFFITPIIAEVSFAKKFLKFAPKIILPLLIMMFISIGIRINAYGVTESRYYVVILALWVFCVMLYLSLAKTIRNIIIPITLSIVTLISVFGPLSSYSISKISQNNRLEKILIRNNMIKDGKLESSANVSTADKTEISNKLNYFNNNHSLKDIKYLPKDFKLQDMDKVFGFPLEYPSYGSPDGYFNFMRDQSNKTIDIIGYDYLIDMRSINAGARDSNTSLNVTYDYQSAIIKINYDKKEVYNKNLNSFARTLTDKYGTVSKTDVLSPEEMTLVEENQTIKVKIIFLNVSGSKNQTTDNVDSKGMDFYLLVKIK